MNRAIRRSIILAALLAGAGCAAKEKLEPLAPHFTVTVPVGGGAAKPMAADPLSGNDQAGALYREDLIEGRPVGGGLANEAPNRIEGLSRTVEQNVVAPGEAGPENGSGRDSAAMKGPAEVGPGAVGRSTTGLATTGLATTGPATSTAGADGQEQYLTVGGVVAEVNGVPIYANKVINLVEPVLAARAKDLTRTQFRETASREITSQRNALITLELEYAASERNLGERDKQLADAMTEQWRTRQINAAGGSIELARRRAAERGDDFDELVQQQYRLMMSRIYYDRKIVPRIQPTAAEIRQYYDRHRDTEFTDPGAARFRLIKIDIAKAGGREQAMEKITTLRNRIAKAGQPFEEIARSVNDDPRLLRTGGDLGAAIEKGAFAIDVVENAVWQTPVGEVTDVIEAAGALYIAKVEEKSQGSVQPFESEQVQNRIADTLRSREFRALRQAEQDRLVKEAVIRSDKEMLNTVIEMAMQNYARWSQAGGGT